MKLILDSLIELGADGLHLAQMQAEAEKIPAFLERFFERDQGFLNLPKLKGQVLQVKRVADGLRGRFASGALKDIVVLGIGGSALCIKMFRDAFKGVYWNNLGSPRLFVADNLDTTEEIEKMCDLDKTLFIVVSKSGETIETLSQYRYFKGKVSRENFVFITDPTDGELRKIGEELSIPMLDIPKNVGGRFSALSPVGLLPAVLLGIDIEALLEGAERMAGLFNRKEFELNLPFQMASIQYLLEWNRGIDITVLMPYSSRLYAMAEWYRQLLAESIGKEGKGLTPMPALGVTDQHSVLQLFNEGPRDKLICFVEIEKASGPFDELINLEKRGTEMALSEYKKPNLTIQIPEINEQELGEMIMFFEQSIAFLGEYYKINAYDQPGVELGKKITNQLLDAKQ